MSYRIRPEKHELRKARETVEKILEGCKHELEKNKVLEINLGVVRSGSTRGHGARGVAVNSETAQIYFDPDIDSWNEDLEKVVRKEFGKSWFYEQMEMSGLVWQELLAETFGLMFLGKVEDREVEKNVEDEWNDKKEKLKKHITPEVQEDFSWELKWVLGRKLMEDYELEDLPELTRSVIEEAGEELE